jgi:hypothetical protein
MRQTCASIGAAVLYQFNMAGAVLQHDNTPYFYQGMDVK